MGKKSGNRPIPSKSASTAVLPVRDNLDGGSVSPPPGSIWGFFSDELKAAFIRYDNESGNE